MKRQYDTFNDHKDDSTHLYISGRQGHKKRRVATPEVDRIVQKFKANPYGLPSQHDDVVEISDCAIFGWWQCLQMLGYGQSFQQAVILRSPKPSTSSMSYRRMIVPRRASLALQMARIPTWQVIVLKKDPLMCPTTICHRSRTYGTDVRYCT